PAENRRREPAGVAALRAARAVPWGGRVDGLRVDRPAAKAADGVRLRELVGRNAHVRIDALSPQILRSGPAPSGRAQVAAGRTAARVRSTSCAICATSSASLANAR